MATYRLQSMIYRRGRTGITLGDTEITAGTEAEAIAQAEVEVERAFADQGGSAVLRADDGRIVWSLRRLRQVTSANDSWSGG